MKGIISKWTLCENRLNVVCGVGHSVFVPLALIFLRNILIFVVPFLLMIALWSTSYLALMNIELSILDLNEALKMFVMEFRGKRDEKIGRGCSKLSSMNSRKFAVIILVHLLVHLLAHLIAHLLVPFVLLLQELLPVLLLLLLQVLLQVLLPVLHLVLRRVILGVTRNSSKPHEPPVKSEQGWSRNTKNQSDYQNRLNPSETPKWQKSKAHLQAIKSKTISNTSKRLKSIIKLNLQHTDSVSIEKLKTVSI